MAVSYTNNSARSNVRIQYELNPNNQQCWKFDAKHSTGDKVVYVNTTCSDEAEERITVIVKEHDAVDTPNDILYPAPKVKGKSVASVQVIHDYVKIENDAVLGKISRPIKTYWTQYFEKGAWTNAELNEMLNRALSALDFTTAEATIPSGQSTTTVLDTIMDILTVARGANRIYG